MGRPAVKPKTSPSHQSLSNHFSACASDTSSPSHLFDQSFDYLDVKDSCDIHWSTRLANKVDRSPRQASTSKNRSQALTPPCASTRNSISNAATSSGATSSSTATRSTEWARHA